MLSPGISMNTVSADPQAWSLNCRKRSHRCSILPHLEAVRHHFGFRYDDVTHEMKIHTREGIYSIILALGNIALLLLFVYFAVRNEIPLDAASVTVILGFITIMNWVTIWHTYEHFMYDYRNLARKRWIFEKITKIPVSIIGI